MFMAGTFYIVSWNAHELQNGTRCQLHATQRRTCQTKSFLFSALTTQPRGLNFCLSFREPSISHLCPHTNHSPRRVPRSNGEFSPRSMRVHRAFRSCSVISVRAARSCCVASANGSAARNASRSISSARRQRPNVFIRPSPPRRRSGFRRAPSPRRRATRSTRCSHFSISRAPAAATSPRRSCSTKCSNCARSRAFRGCAPRCASC